MLVWTNSNTLFQVTAPVNKLGTARTCWSHSRIMQGWSGEGPAAPSTPCLAGRCGGPCSELLSAAVGVIVSPLLLCSSWEGGSGRSVGHGETDLSPSSPHHGVTQQLLHGLM